MSNTEVLIFCGVAIVLLAIVWARWEVKHALPNPEDRDLYYNPRDWEWPDREEDVSSVRHGGLGR